MKFLKSSKLYLGCLFSAIVFLSCSGKSENAQVENSDAMQEEETGMIGDTIPEGSQGGVLTIEEALNSGIVKIADNLIITDNLPVVVDFYTTWCNPCKQYSPTFHEVADMYVGKAIFLSIDAEKYENIANAYSVKAYPTTSFIGPLGAEISKSQGIMQPRALASFVDQLIATVAGENMEI